MKKRVEVAALVVCALLLGYYAYERIGLRMGGTPSSLLSDYATEEDWIVDTILRDLAETAALARGVPSGEVQVGYEIVRSGGAMSLPSVRVDATLDTSPSSRTVALERSFWEPESYAALARDLLLPPADPPRAPESHLAMTALLEPRPNVLVSEDLRISARLQSNPRDVTAHEEAALLLGAFGLREAAWGFSDKRFVLLRMTTHLAIARALRGEAPLSSTGRVAEATLLALSGRQVELQERLKALMEPEVVAAWADALHMYVEEDWRRSSESDSLLVHLMRFRAMTSSLGATTAVERLWGETPHEGLADWARLVNWLGPNVSTASLASDQLGRDLAELREVALSYATSTSLERLSKSLNATPQRLVESGKPRVLGWGLWAAFFQRHLCGGLDARDHLLREGYGLPDDAVEFGHEADALFAGLDMNPIVQLRRTRYVGGQVEDTVGMDGSIAFARRHPELVNAINWHLLEDTARHMMRKRGMPSGASWFSPAVLVTSVSDSTSWRKEMLRAVADEGKVLDALASVAPSHSVVVQMVTGRGKNVPVDYQALASRFAHRLEFDMYTAKGLLELATEPRDRVMLLEGMCRLDAEECNELGWELVYAGEPAKAREVFERFVEKAPNRVGVCNNANWLINHYFDNGELEKAVALADEMEGVYCSWGIRSKAYLLERMGEYEEAERLYLGDAERYEYDAPISPPLAGFYYRMAREVGLPAFEPRLEDALSRVFPRGLESLPPAAEPAPPTDGVFVDGASERLERASLRGGDVIVGLDGFRVHTLDQYDLVRSFTATTSDATAMRFRVWRQAQYVDIEADVPGRRFDVRMRTFGTPGPSYQWR